LISQLVVILKDTSLGAFISYEELLRRGNFAVQNLGNPLQLYLLIGALFIAVNYGLGRLAVLVERRVSRGRRTPAVQAAPPIEAELAV